MGYGSQGPTGWEVVKKAAQTAISFGGIRMAKGIFDVDSTRVRFYDPGDLDDLWKIQRDILDDLIIEGSPWAAPKNADHTRARLAAALRRRTPGGRASPRLGSTSGLGPAA